MELQREFLGGNDTKLSQGKGKGAGEGAWEAEGRACSKTLRLDGSDRCSVNVGRASGAS